MIRNVIKMYTLYAVCVVSKSDIQQIEVIKKNNEYMKLGGIINLEQPISV